MFRLLKYLILFKILNPFQRGFSLVRLLLCLVVAGGFLYFYYPDLFTSLVGKVTRTVESHTGGYQNRPPSGGMSRPGGMSGSGGILAEVLGEGEKKVGDILGNIMNRPPQQAPAPAQSPSLTGGILSEIFGGGSGTSAPRSSGGGYGPPSDFSGGTVTSNPDLFAAYADIGIPENRLNTLPDSPMPLTEKPAAANWVRITSIIDGDTITVGNDKVRLIGIDAPEAGENDHLASELSRINARDQAAAMIYMGQESARFVRQLAEGKRCWLEFDDGGQRDQYGRVLAYVHLEDGTNLNEAILYQGYAKAYLAANHRYLKRYLFIQHEARRRGNGLWRK